MAFSDPQTLTIATVATTFPRILTGTTVGSFLTGDAKAELTIDPRGTAKRRRNVVRLYLKENVTDPGTGLVSEVGYMVSITIDRPLTGITDTKVIDAITALNAWGSASTNANFKKLAAGEN